MKLWLIKVAVLANVAVAADTSYSMTAYWGQDDKRDKQESLKDLCGT